MFYILQDGAIVASSANMISSSEGETIEIDFTPEQLELIEKQYDFIDGEFVKGQRAIQLEESIKHERKGQIAELIGELKNERDGLIELGQDISDVSSKIDALKSEYLTLL